ncbi:MAG: polysulfide reductase NrfD [Planctomycetes bacterium]|nr:polysulfide reductase NrfD [Planctomycetota bacterium]
MVTTPARFWRLTSLVVLAMALAAFSGAIAVLLVAAQSYDRLADETHRQNMLHMQVLIATLLLIALFCIATLIIRYMSHCLQRRLGRHGPTEYVDAWKLAGQRLQVPPRDEDQAQDDWDLPSVE